MTQNEKHSEINTGIKHDAGKPRMDLLPFEALEAVAHVLTFGAKKYDPWNWYKGMDHSRLIAATLRHISADQQGENTDAESGLDHLAHAICDLMFVYTLRKRSKGKDDRCLRSQD